MTYEERSVLDDVEILITDKDNLSTELMQATRLHLAKWRKQNSDSCIANIIDMYFNNERLEALARAINWFEREWL